MGMGDLRGAHSLSQHFHGDLRVVLCDADYLVGIADAKMAFDLIIDPRQPQYLDLARAALAVVAMAVESAMQQDIARLRRHQAPKTRLGESAGQNDGCVTMVVTVTGKHRIGGEFIYARMRGAVVVVLRGHFGILAGVPV